MCYYLVYARTRSSRVESHSDNHSRLATLTTRKSPFSTRRTLPRSERQREQTSNGIPFAAHFAGTFSTTIVARMPGMSQGGGFSTSAHTRTCRDCVSKTLSTRLTFSTHRRQGSDARRNEDQGHGFLNRAGPLRSRFGEPEETSSARQDAPYGIFWPPVSLPTLPTSGGHGEVGFVTQVLVFH
jgi:hypothetical protein